jgi:hypothetical protein
LEDPEDSNFIMNDKKYMYMPASDIIIEESKEDFCSEITKGET